MRYLVKTDKFKEAINLQNVKFNDVRLQSGFWFEKEKLNRETTINAVYHQFDITGRIKAFDFNWYEGDELKPHYYWDSDVAKWMEGAAYILAKGPNADLEKKIDDLIEKIRIHQGLDGYFNIYFTVVEPSKRFRCRGYHELYCAGHLIEAAIACDEIGKPVLLECMKKYVEYIYKVFVVEKSAAFTTPGHEEIELALVRLYRYTGNKLYLDLAAHFINIRGTEEGVDRDEGSQSNVPVREIKEAVGHSVRAGYLYTGMAMLAKETNDKELFEACRTIFDNIVSKKMYVTGGIGSSRVGEAFTNAYDLQNDIAYAETCASIAMMFFCHEMLEIDNNAVYADVIEREFFNSMMSGLSLDGTRFFYVNPLEINLNEHFKNLYGPAKYPITQRPEIFGCSCCPPNINRMLASLGNYIFGLENDTIYVNQYPAATMEKDGVSCSVKTDYPTSGVINVKADGVKRVALRIPSWSASFKLNKAYEMNKGYAIVENDGTDIVLELDMTPHAVFANSHINRDAYKLCIQRGPVVYCAEGVDNDGGELHRFSVAPDFTWSEKFDTASGLPELDISAYKLTDTDALYSVSIPKRVETNLHLIPYSSFANRGESDMRIWFNAII